MLPSLLDRHARATPDKEFIRFESGERWTFAETQSLARRTAAALRRCGIASGEAVLVWLPNGAAVIRAWFGSNLAGAYFVPLNTSYRGRLLSHAIAQSGARVMIVHAELAPRLAEIPATQLETLLIVGNPDLLSGSPLDGPEDGVPDAAVERWDAQMVIFTSGTTGPSKGVLCSYLQMYTVGRATYGYLNGNDRMLIDLPMFHVGGVSPIIGALAAGCSVALFDGFSTERFWERVRAFGATTTSGLVGSMASFLSKLPPRPDDAVNPLRMVVMGPLTQQAMELARRHAFQYCSGFNMTELSTPLVTGIDTPVPASCGKPRSGCECRVVDANDIECPPGKPGELVVRN
ncbi:MAG: AMP-binding protein, partial [Steroidobacteraceae bacterium]